MSKSIRHVNILIFIHIEIKFVNINVYIIGANECYLMIQWGSGNFEYSFNDEVIFTGRLEFLQNNNVISEKSDRKKFDQFFGSVSEDEVYASFENNGFHLGDNFKNITNVDLYKNNIQGSVKWQNDWIYFLDGLLKFPLLENIDIRFNEGVASIRQITIDPKTLEKNVEGGTRIFKTIYTILTLINNTII